MLFNTDGTWHKCWLNLNLCNSMLHLKFPVTMATGGCLKIAKKITGKKLISKGCNFSMHWDRVKGFSAFVTLYLKIDLSPFSACQMSKIGDDGDCRPLQTPPTEGVTPPSGNPLMYHFDWGCAEKFITFFWQNISNEKQCFRTFCLCLRPQKRGTKSHQNKSIWGKR
jgi:hypothetical protein